MNTFRLIHFIILFLFFVGCKNKPPYNSSENISDTKQTEAMFNIIAPVSGSIFKEDQLVLIEAQSTNDSLTFDSLVLYVDSKRISTLSINKRFEWRANVDRLGKKPLSIVAYKNGQKHEKTIYVKFYAGYEPPKINYSVINTFPHSITAYTQGLLYNDGYLYESNGEYGKSVLRKVDISTGKTIMQYELDDNFFAEGITLFQGKIYQITWRENTCFVYDINSLEPEKQFNYTLAEGWGLTTDTDNKIFFMTDGTNKVYIVEPESFNIIKYYEIYDNNGPVQHLNELEYVKGYLFANVYQTDKIIIIDVTNWRIAGVLHMQNLLKPSDYKANTDVLNGIAYNYEKNTFYVTGKNWPKLFEIKIHFNFDKK